MKTFVISLGGSIIVPDEVDIGFIKKFKELIEEYVSKGYKFVIYCGGGSLARKYQDAYRYLKDQDSETQDWIGISATHHNALLLRAIFHEIAEEKIIYDPNEKIEFNKSLIFAGGWKPGWSTDYDAVLVAKQLGITNVVNMSNIDHVYDKDPNKNSDAQALEKISWKDFRKLVGDEWKPGLNMPFDPVASKEAEKIDLKVYVVGKDLDNLKKVLDGEKFKGTIIE